MPTQTTAPARSIGIRPHDMRRVLRRHPEGLWPPDLVNFLESHSRAQHDKVIQSFLNCVVLCDVGLCGRQWLVVHCKRDTECVKCEAI